MPKSVEKQKRGVAWRAVIIGLILIPLNSYWIFLTEIIRYAGHPTTISLFYNSICWLAILLLVNMIFKRRLPQFALSQSELLTIYIMINIGSALVGHDFIQVFVPLMIHPFMYGNATNNWPSLFANHMPKWLTVRDQDAVQAFYHGAASIYDPSLFLPWLAPVLWWSLFIIAMVGVFLCINVLLRKQWTEHERLAYPLVTLPLDMTAEKSPFWRNRLLWIGFGIVAVIDIVNGLNTLYPSIPAIPIKLGDQGTAFANKPWNAIGWLPVMFYPFGIALGMLLPIDLLFSCWFFFWVWKAQLIIANYYGWNIIPGFPFPFEQSFGAYMGLAMFAILISRRHVWKLIRHFFGLATDLNDSGEALSYRPAMCGVALGALFLYIFSRLAGMSPPVIIAFFVFYFALILAITRLRVELGAPAHDLHAAGPDRLIPSVVGHSNVNTANLTMLTMFYGFNRAYRCHPSPFQLEGFKMAERTNKNYSALFWAMLLATIVGTLAAFWANLHHLYRDGAAMTPPPVVPLVYGNEAYGRLESWLKAPTPPNTKISAAIAVGFIVTLLLDSLRMKLPWFPLHPVGYAISGSWSMSLLWTPMFVAWLVKLITLRYSGLRGYRTVLPFFMGIILGECLIGGLWTLIGGLFRIPTYAFWP